MRRVTIPLLLVALGCNRATVTVAPAPAPSVGPSTLTTPPAPEPNVAASVTVAAVPRPEPTPQEKYDTALWNALTLVADNKLVEALAALQTAQSAVDTEQVRGEIERLKGRLNTKTTVERIAADIRTVLTEGTPEEAAKLATEALNTYGDSEASETIIALKRQADALVTARLDAAARLSRFRQEAESAEQAKDLRRAVLAYEQAVMAGGAEDVRRKLDTHRASLARYEDARRRAADFRRDADKLDEALAALREAAAIWDTQLIRQEIDDCTLAIQSRRDRLAVADFETLGDVGLPAAGRTIAEDLLPAFKARYDLVERGQIGKVLDELRLAASDITANTAARGEVAKLARIRYLVVGSVTPLSGVTVHARLIDVKTGLVVQTGKVNAPTAEGVLPLLPSLAALLQMTDEQRLAYERQLAAQAPAPVVVAEAVHFPSLDELIPNNPAPIIVNSVRPPDIGGCGEADFAALPPPGATAGIGFEVAKDHKMRLRALAVAVELGDNLFRRGRYREAFDQYQIALALSDGRTGIAVRAERCRPFLPPPPPVPIVARPRVVVLDFVPVSGAVVPSGLGAWTAGQLGPYLCPPYEVVDRDEVNWYAGRLGVTLRDIVVDPSVRACLGRALNARYVVVGTLRGGLGGIDTVAHLLDAESGSRVATADIHASDPTELKYRVPELARALLLNPGERDRIRREAEQERAALAQVKQVAGTNLSLAVSLAGELSKKSPGSVAVQVLYQQLDRRAQAAALEAARQREAQQQAAATLALQRRQAELARAAEAARMEAVRQAAAAAESDRQRQRDAAYTQLLAQAREARAAQKYDLAAQIFDSVLGLQRRDDVFREAAAVRALAAEQARIRTAEDVAQRERQLRQQREAELARVRTEVENERLRREAEDQARRRVQDDLDRKEYGRLIAQAEQFQKAGNYDGAVAALQSAKRLRPGDEAERLLSSALLEQAKAAARKLGDQAQKDLDAKLAAEKQAKEKAEADARRNLGFYAAAMQAAEVAMRAKNYDAAVTQYQNALKLYRNDAALTGLKAAQDARDAEKVRADADAKRVAAEKQSQAEVARLLAAGQAALTSGQPDKALDAYRLALKIAPGNVDVLAGISKAEQAKLDALAVERKKVEPKAGADLEAKAKVERDSDSRAKAEADRIAREAKAKSAKEAADRIAKANADAKIDADAKAKADKEKADRAKSDAEAAAKAKAEAETKQRRAEFDRLLKAGRDAMTAKRYGEAVQTLTAALREMPGNPEATQLLASARDELAKAKAAPPKAKSPQLPVEYVKQMNEGASLVRQQKYADAQKAYEAAIKALPNDPEATRRVEYAKRMDAGTKAMKANKKADAVKEFEAALKAIPRDEAATKALQQAKN
ncbi:MAG: hypothetical protein U0746_12070 [Gemmataceae bacterium]